MTSAQAVKSLFCGEDPASNEQTINKLIDYHNNHLKHTLEWGTMKKLHDHAIPAIF
jgi:hypothetical protein